MGDKNKRILYSLGIALILLIFFELAYFFPNLFFFFVVLAFFFFIFSFILRERKEKSSLKVHLFKITLPLFLVISSASFVFFESGLFLHLMLIAVFFSFYLFFSRLEFPFSRKESRNLTYFWLDFLIFVVAFLTYLAIYNLEFIFRAPLFFLLILATGFSFFIFYYSLWARSESSYLSFFFSLLFALTILETFFVLSFWQENPVPKSLIFLTILYFFSGVLDYKLKGRLEGKKILEYLVVSFLVLVLVIVVT